MRALMIAAVAALCASQSLAGTTGNGWSHEATSAVAPPIAAHHCTRGVLCGDRCISRVQICHVPRPRAPNCKTGKPCGDVCIPRNKTCHPSIEHGPAYPVQTPR